MYALPLISSTPRSPSGCPQPHSSVGGLHGACVGSESPRLTDKELRGKGEKLQPCSPFPSPSPTLMTEAGLDVSQETGGWQRQEDSPGAGGWTCWTVCSWRGEARAKVGRAPGLLAPPYCAPHPATAGPPCVPVLTGRIVPSAMGDLASRLGCLGEGRLHARAKTWAQGDPPHQGSLGLVGPRALEVTEVTQTVVMRLWRWGLAIQPG